LVFPSSWRRTLDSASAAGRAGVIRHHIEKLAKRRH
jgi:hypothetical protein